MASHDMRVPELIYQLCLVLGLQLLLICHVLHVNLLEHIEFAHLAHS